MGITQHLPHKDGVNFKCVDSYKALGAMPGAWQVGIVVFKKVCFLQHRNLTQIALPRKVSQRRAGHHSGARLWLVGLIHAFLRSVLR